jgi:predicted pyridoxine 5'-phosphate oxidase superfamily flavin-nucleotide-binding protein
MNHLTPEIKDFVNRVKLGFIATVCPDGTPNLSPKGSTIAWDTKHLVFADVCSPGTIANLLVNPAIEINVVDIFIRKGYRFKGTAKVFSEGAVFNEVVSYYRHKGSQLTIKNIVVVEVDKIHEILSPAYDTGTTQEEIREKWTEYWKLNNK